MTNQKQPQSLNDNGETQDNNEETQINLQEMQSDHKRHKATTQRHKQESQRHAELLQSQNSHTDMQVNCIEKKKEKSHRKHFVLHARP